MTGFNPSEKHKAAQRLMAGPQTHTLLYGGSRSGKTFLFVRAIIMRALKAPRSRHAIMRFRFSHVRQSIGQDTMPNVLEKCFPTIHPEFDSRDWFWSFENGAQVWLGGLDDKERTEKILGQEYATIYLNECSQIPYSARNMAVTRLAQNVTALQAGRQPEPLRPRMFYDANPPAKNHWLYRLFIAKEDPETAHPLLFPDDYAAMQVNPRDNRENLAPDYIEKTLAAMPARMRKRFLEGEFGDANPNALWTDSILERWRVVNAQLPDLQRVIIGIDPSGSGDEDNVDNDEIGIVIAALGTDGVGYILEDVSLKAGPAKWGAVAVSAFERHAGDAVVAEVNYGGAMVQHVIQTATEPGHRQPPFRAVTASRGKVVRAEPISALFEQGKIRLVGDFRELEQEMLSFTTTGYVGEGSPNRADAMIWACYELFPGLIRMQRRVDGPRQQMAEM